MDKIGAFCLSDFINFTSVLSILAVMMVVVELFFWWSKRKNKIR